MKQFIPFLLLMTAGLCSCAMSPARNVLAKDTMKVDIALGGALMDSIQGLEWIPLPVNLSVGAGYGVSDSFTAGANWYVLPALMGQVVLEPYGTYNLYKDTNGFNGNVMASVPFNLNVSKINLDYYPTISVAPVFKNDKASVYTAVEFPLDSTSWGFSWGWKAGGDFRAWNHGLIGGEIGLVNIGEESSVSPLSRAGIGVPVFSIGTSIDAE